MIPFTFYVEWPDATRTFDFLSMDHREKEHNQRYTSSLLINAQWPVSHFVSSTFLLTMRILYMSHPTLKDTHERRSIQLSCAAMKKKRKLNNAEVLITCVYKL